MGNGETFLDQRAAKIKTDADDSINYRIASDIEMKPVSWLWPGRIARGKISIIAGHPGLGKSQLTASLAAVETTGGQWPVDRTRAGGGNVIILSAEDDADDTITPRLAAAGADLSKVHIISSVSDCDPEDGPYSRSVNLTKDIPGLENLLQKIGNVSLVIIDPISAYMGRTDSKDNAQVRTMLTPLAEVAQRHGAAVLGISHLNKGSGGGSNEAIMRVTGSMAFVAAARSAYAVIKDKDDPRKRLFLPLKNNLGNDETGLAFHVEGVTLENGIGTSRILWGSDHVTVSADEAMDTSGDVDRTATDEAEEWLSDLLMGGGMKASDVQKQARQAGISDRALRRAREKLGIKPQKTRFDGGWQWELPSKMPQDAQDALTGNEGAFDTRGHLRNGTDDIPDIDAAGNVAASGRTAADEAPKVNGRALTAPFVDIGEVPEPPESGWEAIPL